VGSKRYRVEAKYEGLPGWSRESAMGGELDVIASRTVNRSPYSGYHLDRRGRALAVAAGPGALRGACSRTGGPLKSSQLLFRLIPWCS